MSCGIIEVLEWDCRQPGKRRVSARTAIIDAVAQWLTVLGAASGASLAASCGAGAP